MTEPSPTAVPAPASTWSQRVEIANPTALFARLKQSGLPLADVAPADGTEADTEGSSGGCIVALVSVSAAGLLSAVVATPSAIVYRFEPDAVEPQWWSFAARYYYVVTGNLADRQRLAELVQVDAKSIKGRTCSRRKVQALSGMTLDDLLDHVAPEWATAGQDTLFQESVEPSAASV